jgi:hypothetical protein
LIKCKCFEDIVKRTYNSKRMFDGGNYSDVFAIMNLLWDYNRIPSSKSHQFAKENAVSLPRLNRILSTRKNLQLRVSLHLKVPLVSLCTKQSPREMTSSTMTVLRLIKTWVFHDSLIALSPNKKRMDTGAFSLKLEGDPVKKSQFRSILDCDSFHLDSTGEIRYKGRYEVTSIDCVPLVVDAKSFESRLLSLVIEKNAKVLCHRAGDSIYLYSITADVIEKIKSMLQFDDDVHVTDSMEGHRNVSNHRGWRGRICGTWKVLGSTSREMLDAVLTDDDDRINISCQRYCLGSMLHAKRKYKLLASSLLPFRTQFDIVCIEADPSKTHGPIEILHYSRTHNIYFEASELKDLFSTPHITLQTAHTKYSQELVFGGNKEIINANSTHKGWFETTQAPWEVRLLTALACSQRTSRKPFLSLPKAAEDSEGQLSQNQDNGKSDTTDSSFSIISFDVENLRGQWKWVETEGHAVVDRMSIPATITPQNHVVYACCGNILELKGGAVLAENLTILPPSENFVSMAFTCFGLPPPMSSSGTDEDSLDFCRNGMEEIDLSGVDLECAICLSELRHPKITNCRHLFCNNCIISLIDYTDNTPRCPCCRFELNLNEIKDVVSKRMNERMENAKHFNSTLKTLMTSSEKKSLCYSRDLVELLCNVFHNLDGLEVLPWDDSMTMEVRSSEPMTKQENPIDFLLKEMGRNNLPSSFVHLLDEQEEITMQNSSPTTSNHFEIQGDMDNDAPVIASAGDFLQNLLLTSTGSNVIQPEQENESTTHDEMNIGSIFRQRGVDLTAAVMSSRCYTHPYRSNCDDE